ncbi:hypothetical protein ONZ45_g16951 [Pleurotus djamor]|nr:hypothetical protein ONZ45_g16951 [Pleurotus djamor]
MVFYAYVTESNTNPALHVNQVELKFMDPKTADEWWCAVSEIPRLAEAIRRVNPRLYSNDTTKFDITTFFTSFDATIRAISQRFRQKLIITLVRINDEDEPDDDPPKPLAAMSKRPPQVAPVVERIGGINGNGNRNW